MLSSVDGRIDGAALGAVISEGEYEATGAKLGGDAWICGRTTMQQHFAEDEPYVSASNNPAGPQPVHVAHRADSYAISVDTIGKLRWASGELGGDHLICVMSERVPKDYLAMLREKGISYVVSGASSVDLARALALLRKDFGIHTLLLEGGGHINGAFLQAGLIDEVSLLVVPGIDGRRGVPAVFDGIDAAKSAAAPLELKSVEKRKNGTVWIRYEVIRSQQAKGRNNANT
jgi:2,5-diamino-6-(ribosylamino)-4(3H)-pyrimidinone 5'-phosphate reductase